MSYVAPVVLVEIAPGFSPSNPPGSSDWEVLTIGGKTRLRGFSMNRGRSDVLDKFEASTATFVLDNSDGLLDELNPAGLAYGPDRGALTPIRLRSWIPTGWSYYFPIFTGFIRDGWEPSQGRGDEQTVTVDAIDLMGWAASVDVPSTQLAAAIKAGDPAIWWRGDMTSHRISPGSGQFAYNSGSLGSSQNGVAMGGPPGDITAAEPLIADSNETGNFGAMRVHTGARLHTGVNVARAAQQIFACVFQIGPGTQSNDRYLVVGRSGSSLGAVRWAVRLSPGGRISAELWDGSGNITSSVTTGTADHLRHNDGKPHLVVVQMQDGDGHIDLCTDLDYVSNTGFPGIGTGGYVVTGSNTGNDPRILIDEWALITSDSVNYDHPLAAMFWAPAASDLLDGNFSLFDEDSSLTSRMSSVADQAGMGLWDVFEHWPEDWQPPGPGPYMPPTNLAAAIEGIGDSLAGAAYCKRGGRVFVRGWREMFRLRDLAEIHTEITDADPAPTGVSVIRYTSRGRTGKRIDRVINEVSINNGVPRRDLASIERYGKRPHVIDSAAGSVETTEFAQKMLAHRAEPTYEINDITLRPWGDQKLTTWVVRDLELEKRVLYTEHSPDGVKRMDKVPVRVQGESWNWDGGTDWTVVLKLAEGWEDAGKPLPELSKSTNLCVNPSAEVSTDGWSVVNGTLTRDTAVKVGRLASLRVTGNSATNRLSAWTSTDGWTPGDVMYVSAWVRSDTWPTFGGLEIVVPGSSLTNPIGVTPPSSHFTVVRFSTTINVSGSVPIYFRARPSSPQASGARLWIDDVLISRNSGFGQHEYFDGSWDQIPAYEGYQVEWDGTPHLSTSTRSKLI